MKKALRYILSVLCVLLTLSCERRPLYDGLGGYLYIDIEVDVETNTDFRSFSMPEMFAVAFYDPETHKLLQTEYVSGSGGLVDVSPGTYDIIVYNIDTEYVQVRNQRNLYELEAFTSDVTADVASRFTRVTQIITRNDASGNTNSRSYEGNPLIYEPDHLYAELVKSFTVPVAVSEGQAVHLKVHPTTICEKFSITIGPVKNGEYIRSAEVFLTGMASAKLVAERTMSGGPATIWFPINLNTDVSEFSTIFYSFGKFPNADNYVFLVVHLVDSAGNEYDGEWNVTDQLENGGHVIIINTDIDIPIPEPGGGFDPSVNPWNEDTTNILL